MQTFALTTINNADMPSNKFGALIRSLRESRAMTQTDLAERTGISQQTIAKWEAGIAAPRPSNLQVLADALGVHQWDLAKAKAGIPTALDRLNAARGAAAGSHEVEAQHAGRVFAAEVDHAVITELMSQGGEGREKARYRVGSRSFVVDYASDKLILEVKATEPQTLERALRSAVLEGAWNLSLIGRTMRDTHPTLAVIVVVPGGMPAVRSLPDGGRIEELVRRRREEANIAGVTLEIVGTPEEAATLARNFERFGDQADDLI